jgi:hypothetical protein
MAIEYTAYAIGPDDCIVMRIDLVCADDDAAKEHARQIVNGHAIELWRGKTLLAWYEPLQ